jgi:glutamate-1-semialdehyde 2,1-aminomutase
MTGKLTSSRLARSRGREAVPAIASRIEERLRQIEREYSAGRPRSRALFQRATASLPGGETRSVTNYSPFPVNIVDGQGSSLFDVDGHEYLDLVNNYTSLVHGNAYPAAMDAVAASLPRGTALASPTLEQVQLAEEIIARVASVDLVRFTNSGSEASVLAARIAFASTGRRKLVVFHGAYHGALPPFVFPDGGTVVRVPFNDLDAVRVALANGSIAAVFAEPFLGAGGVLLAEPGFLAAVQELSRSAGALFILDEIQSLRLDVGGVQAQLGLDPDLTTMGKIIGGGFAVGAVGGRQDLLLLTDSNIAGSIQHTGTFNGHIPAMIAGLATLRGLDGDAIAAMEVRSARLAGLITDGARLAGLPCVVTRAGSILNVHLRPDPPTVAVSGPWSPLARAVHLSLLLGGVYTTPRGMLNLSTAVTDQQVERAGLAFAATFFDLVRSV